MNQVFWENEQKADFKLRLEKNESNARLSATNFCLVLQRVRIFLPFFPLNFYCEH